MTLTLYPHTALIAQNILCPGFSTLIYLLTTSISDNMSQRLQKNPQLSKAKWVGEYLQGARMEIYSVPLSDEFIGFDYTAAVCTIFEKYGSLLFGIKVMDPLSSETKNIFLNPQGYIFTGGEIGYFITTNARDATKIAQEGPGMDGQAYFDHDSPLSDRSRISRASPNAPSRHGSQEDIIPLSLPPQNGNSTVVI